MAKRCIRSCSVSDNSVASEPESTVGDNEIHHSEISLCGEAIAMGAGAGSITRDTGRL